MSEVRCIYCSHPEGAHYETPFADGQVCHTAGCGCERFADEPSEAELDRHYNGPRPSMPFEGHGDFYSDDPMERYEARQAAKGNR